MDPLFLLSEAYELVVLLIDAGAQVTKSVN